MVAACALGAYVFKTWEFESPRGYKKDWLFALKILPGCHKTSRFFCGPIFSVRFDLVIWLRQGTDETGKE